MHKIVIRTYCHVVSLCTLLCVITLLYSCISAPPVVVPGDRETIPDKGISVTQETEVSGLQNIYPQYPREIIDLYASMSERQRIAQLMIIRLQYPNGQWIKTANTHVATYLNNVQPGGILLSGENVTDAAQVTMLTAYIKEQLPITPFIAIDVEGEKVNRLSKIPRSIFSDMPAADTIADTKTVKETYRYMYNVGQALYALGINMDLAPVADVRYSTTHDFLQTRIFGNTAQETAAYVRATMQGLQAGQVIAVLKHFPGHGSASVDTHVGLATVNLSQSELTQTDWLPYTTAMQHNLQAVMLGHLVVPAIDTVVATKSPKIVNILRNQMGFSGLIMTDSLDMEAVQESGESFFERAALNAGVDIMLGSVDVEAVLSQLVESHKDGTLNAIKIEQATLRVLYTKYINKLL